MNKGPNATIRLVRRQNHAGTTVSWTTVQREKNSHAYKLSSNVQTACSTDSLNNCPKHSFLRFSSFALKIYLWLKMCQHNLPCSIVLPTACFPEGPSPHFTLCSFWRRRPRLEAVLIGNLAFLSLKHLKTSFLKDKIAGLLSPVHKSSKQSSEWLCMMCKVTESQILIFVWHMYQHIWASAWDFQQCGMCDQQSFRSAYAYAQSYQSLC